MSKTGSRHEGYDTVAMGFHWITVLLLVAQYTVGLTMPNIGRHAQDQGLIALHFSIGVTILFVTVLRIAWKLVRPAPPPPAMARWQIVLSRAVEGILYLMILIITLLGWAAMSYRGWTVSLFGVMNLPSLAPKGAGWAHTAGDVHNVLVYPTLDPANRFPEDREPAHFFNSLLETAGLLSFAFEAYEKSARLFDISSGIR